MPGWSGHVPAPCRNTLIAIPQDYAPFLWGWPHRLTKRLKAHGSDVILLGPYDGSGFSSGIETPEALARVPAGFDGYLWTNRIEVIGPRVKP
jgi:glycerophosphoryl diester phosphodiesterase